MDVYCICIGFFILEAMVCILSVLIEGMATYWHHDSAHCNSNSTLCKRVRDCYSKPSEHLSAISLQEQVVFR